MSKIALRWHFCRRFALIYAKDLHMSKKSSTFAADFMDSSMATISNATKSNWQRLHTSSEGRLAKRANKTLSAKKVIAASYAQTDNASTLLKIVSLIDAPLEDIIYTLGLRRLEAAGILYKSNVQKTLVPYQSYLNLNLDVPIEVWETDDDLLGFVLQSMLSEGERNATGQYYTNKEIVRTMVNGLPLSSNETFYDPCCGSGAFLLGVDTDYPENLYGTDLNPLAVYIAKINLLIKYAKKDFIPNIDCADFLKDKTSRKYDYIYTNPPWGADKNHQYQIKGIKSKERASMFLVKAVDLLKPQGHLHFLLPTSLLKIQVHADVRKFILANCTIQNIELYKDRFDGVFTDYFSIKILPRPTNCQVYEVKKNNQTFKLTYTVTPDQSDIRLSEKNPLDESIKRKVALRANDYLTHSKWALGIVTGNNKEKLLSEREGAAEPIYTGKEIEPYTVAGERKYIVFDPANFQQCAKEEFFRAPEKLVYRFIANRPIVAYDDRQRLCLNSANILIPDVESLSTKTVAALLNSALYQYLYLSNFSDVKVLKSNLSSLPFPKLSSSEDSYFASIVDMIISHDSNAHRLCSLIDDRVFEIFDISSTERDWIMSKRFAE